MAGLHEVSADRGRVVNFAGRRLSTRHFFDERDRGGGWAGRLRSEDLAV